MTARSDQLGSVVVPPTTGGAGVSLAATCDPVITNLLAAFKAIANLKLSAAWKAAAGLIGNNNDLIGDTFPHEPTRASAERTWNGCALFMWRDKEKLGLRTQVYEEGGCTGQLMFVMPPLGEEELVKLQPIRNALKVCLDLAVKHFGDPGYTPTFGPAPGRIAGGDILTQAGADEFSFTEAEYARLPVEVGLEQWHGALLMTWLLKEDEQFVTSQYETLTQIETTITSKDDTGETTAVETQYTP